jgi:hypothetical protein
MMGTIIISAPMILMTVYHLYPKMEAFSTYFLKEILSIYQYRL